MTANAEYAEQMQKRLQESTELRKQEQAKAERIRDESIEQNRKDDVRVKGAQADEREEKAKAKQVGKGINVDEMA
jgi:hypothetical protein